MLGTIRTRDSSMATMSRADPTRIVDALCAYWETSALAAAIDLGLFSALGRRTRSAAELAATCQADRERLIRLCDSLVSLGFLDTVRGRYRAAADAARFLDPASRHSVAASRQFFAGPALTDAFANLAHTVRSGASGRRVSADRLWPAFARSTLALRRREAAVMARALIERRVGTGRILDLGGGASPLGIELLRRSRAATLVVRDRAPVAAVARQHAIDSGVADRVAIIGGDLLRGDWEGPFDLVLMVNVLDYFDRPAQLRLLRRARQALRPGGSIAIVAPLLAEGRQSPPDAVAYDLLLLALGTPGRPATWRERRQQVRRAGFAVARRVADPSMVIARRAL